LCPQSANTGLLLRIRDSCRCSEEGEAEGEENQNLLRRGLRFWFVVVLPEPAGGIRDKHHVWERFEPIPLDRFARSKYSEPDAEATTLADHLYQTSLTVVLRQKRQVVTPITPKNQDRSYVSINGGVDYAEIYDVKDHHRVGAASSRINCRNDRSFC
jgi:hypothetical protein